MGDRQRPRLPPKWIRALLEQEELWTMVHKRERYINHLEADLAAACEERDQLRAKLQGDAEDDRDVLLREAYELLMRAHYFASGDWSAMHEWLDRYRALTTEEADNGRT